jgi:predicted phage terminase large subunit-like protein
LSDEDRFIQQEWIDEHRYSELPPRNQLRFFQGVDPATGKHDGTAMVGLAQHVETGVFYVLPSFAERCSEQRTVDMMVQLYRSWHFAAIGWEEVAFSGIYGNFIQKLAAEKGIYLPIVKVGTRGQSKEMRVRSYSMLIQGGLIRFPERGCSNIEQQLTEFPLGAYDDLCDGIWLAIQAAQMGGGGTVTGSAIKAAVKTAAKDIIRRVRR